MNFKYFINVGVNRTEGKFASRDEIAAQIQEALEEANPGSCEGDNGGQYEITDWDVDEDAPAPKMKTPKQPSMKSLSGLLP